MKRMCIFLVLASHLSFAQNNVALLHTASENLFAGSEEVADLTVAPFELIKGMIVVQAQANGHTGSFILDTGAPAMVIDNKGTHDGAISGKGVGGDVAIGNTQLKEFSFGNIHRRDLKSYSLDMSHLEVACGRDIMGLIGYEVLQHYELLFDYANQIIEIYPAKTASHFRPMRPSKTVSFHLQDHVPVVVMKIGGKKAYLGVDSGAAANLLDKGYFVQMEDCAMSDICKEWLTGLDNLKQPVIAADIRYSSFKGGQLGPMRFLFTDMSSLEAQLGYRLDGLLGYPFFKGQKVAINYKKKKIYLW